MQFLSEWLTSKNRKPLIIRGARQVGKTWLVREFSKIVGRELTEVNFEKQPQIANLFSSNNPSEILVGLGAYLNQSIESSKSLLFLDEIQAAPELLSKMRWFAESLPELPIIGAGSLLEFTLEKATFSIPVGRISYMYLEPFSFEEFLLAKKKEQLYKYLHTYTLNLAIPQILHEQLDELFKEYVIIGGMPAAVKSWVTEQSLDRINQISHDLLGTYRDDFGKYRGHLPIERLDEILAGIPLQLGQKFIYSRINKAANTVSIKQALTLLNKAMVAHKINNTAANGAPLGAEVNEKYFKEIFLDVGLCSTSLGLILHQIKSTHEISLINRGGVAEQVVGQLLRTINPPYIEPALYYWHREKKGSEAEIDYVIQHRNQVVPIEVKAGSIGSLKSLHLFMSLKRLPLALRINSDFPSVTQVNVKDHKGKQVEYNLLSLPFYLLGQINRLIETVKQSKAS